VVERLVQRLHVLDVEDVAAESMKLLTGDQRVLHPEAGPVSSGQMNSIPAPSGNDSRFMSPCERFSGVSAIST
jgi:hypothetical protein